MGWNDDISTEERRLDRKRVEEERLQARAEKVGLDLRAYTGGDYPGGLRWEQGVRQFKPILEAAEKKRKARQTKKAKDEQRKKEELHPAPEGLTPAGKRAWYQADTDAERDKVMAEQVNVTAPVKDPYKDREYEAMGGEIQDEFQLATDVDVSPYQYRHTLLAETPGQSTENTMNERGQMVHAQGITPYKYIQRIWSMDESELEDFQHDLFDAGFYGSVQGHEDEEPMWGTPDETTIAAVKQLTYSTMQYKGKMSITEVLDLFKRRHAEKLKKGEKDKPKPVITLTSQVDLADAANQSAEQLMGRRLQDGEVSAATGGYNALESTYQQGSQQAQIDNKAGTFVAPPSASAYAEQQLRAQYAPEVDSYNYLHTINALMQELGLAG